MEIKNPTVLGDLSFRLGGVKMPVTSYTTTPVTINDTDWGTFKVGILDTAQTVNLPDVAAATGKMFIFKVMIALGSGTVAVTRAGSANIDGATSYTLDAQYESVILVSDGTDWHIAAKIA